MQADKFSILKDPERKYSYCAALLIVEKGAKILKEFLVQKWQHHIKIPATKPTQTSFGQDFLSYEFSQGFIQKFHGTAGYRRDANNINNIYYRSAAEQCYGLDYGQLKLRCEQIQVMHDLPIDQWDVTLLSALLRFSGTIKPQTNPNPNNLYPFVSKSSEEGIKELTNLRNNEYGHIQELKMSLTSFNDLIQMFFDAVNKIDVYIRTEDIVDMKLLSTATLPDDEILSRYLQQKKEMESLLKIFAEDRKIRLVTWLEKFCPLNYEQMIRASENNRVVENGTIIPKVPVRNTTGQSLLSTASFARKIGGKQLVAGKLLLNLVPEGINLPELIDGTEIIVGDRSLLENKYNITSNLRDFDVHPLIQEGIINENKWILAVDNDNGLAVEEFKIYYDPLIPAWVAVLLPAAINKMYVYDLNGKKKKELIQEKDFVVLERYDTLQFGRRKTSSSSAAASSSFSSSENHKLIILNCNINSSHRLPFEGLKKDSITNHEILGNEFIKKGNRFIYPAKRGGLSMIYKAKAIGGVRYEGQEFAFKCPYRVEHFNHLHKEIQILSKIGGCSRIITLRDIFLLQQGRDIQKTSVPILKMDWAKYGSLHDFLKDELFFHDEFMKQLGNDPPKLAYHQLCRIIDILIQITEAIEYAHGRDITHADLKPGNILVMDYRSVTSSNQWFVDIKLCDFNISSGNDVLDQTFLPSIGSTHGYRAPEQCQQIINELPNNELSFVTGKPDIWSLGMIMIQLFSHNQWSLPDVNDYWSKLREDYLSTDTELGNLVCNQLRAIANVQNQFNSNELNFLALLTDMVQFLPSSRTSATNLLETLRGIAENLRISDKLSVMIVTNSSYIREKYLLSMSPMQMQESLIHQLLERSEQQISPMLTIKEQCNILIRYCEMSLIPPLPVTCEQFFTFAQRLNTLSNSYSQQQERIEKIRKKVQFYQELNDITFDSLLPTVNFYSFQDLIQILNALTYRDLSELIPTTMGPFYHKYASREITSKPFYHFAHALHFALEIQKSEPNMVRCDSITYGRGKYSLRVNKATSLLASPSAEVTWELKGEITSDLHKAIKHHVEHFQLVVRNYIKSFLPPNATDLSKLMKDIRLIMGCSVDPDLLVELLTTPELEGVISNFREKNTEDTLLHILFQDCCYESNVLEGLVDFFISVGGDQILQVLNRKRETPFHVACSASRKFVSSELIYKLAFTYPELISIPTEISMDTKKGLYYPLHYYLAAGPTKWDDVLTLFIEKCPDAVHQITKIKSDPVNGELAIHSAVSNPNTALEVIQILYDQYPDGISMRGKYNDIPLSFAVYKSGNPEVIRFLLDTYGKNGPDHCYGCASYDSQGNLPLHTAIQYGPMYYDETCFEVIELLFKKFPDALRWLNFVDKSPLELAEEVHGIDSKVFQFLKAESTKLLEGNEASIQEIIKIRNARL